VPRIGAVISSSGDALRPVPACSVCCCGWQAVACGDVRRSLERCARPSSGRSGEGSASISTNASRKGPIRYPFGDPLEQDNSASRRTDWRRIIVRVPSPEHCCELDLQGDPFPRAINLSYILLYAAPQGSWISLSAGLQPAARVELPLSRALRRVPDWAGRGPEDGRGYADGTGR
jgi:hypothetical protein